jgi:hypothetical protein
VRQLIFTIFHLFVLNIVPRIFWLCRNLLLMTTPCNKLKTCIMNSKLWWSRTRTLWRFTTCWRFWIIKNTTCKAHHLIKRTWPMLIESKMHMRGLYLFLMGHYIILNNTRFCPNPFCVLIMPYVFSMLQYSQLLSPNNVKNYAKIWKNIKANV